MPNITHDNHYVPRAMLKRWTQDGVHLWAYGLVVSRAEVAAWERKPIAGLALQSDLYTAFANGDEVDDFENFITRNFEEPGAVAIEKLINRARMTPEEFRSIGRYVVAQDVRTPLSFIESIQRFNKIIPDALKKSVDDLEKRTETGQHIPRHRDVSLAGELQDAFRVRVEPKPDSDRAVVRLGIESERSLWVRQMRHILLGVAKIVETHRWSVVRPYGSEEWPLTDHPVIRLNFSSPTTYDLGGGFGKPGCDIIMPIAPKLALFTQVGKKHERIFELSSDHTKLVQRLLLERAF
jgi:Protein of unknown function (DUF4238)